MMPEPHSHYQDRERLLEEAHEEFLRLYTASSAIDCDGLQPL